MLGYFDRKYGKNPTVNLFPLQARYGLQTMPSEINNAFMEFTRAREFIIRKLTRELKPSLFYHNAQHTLDVIRSVETLALMEKVDDGKLLLLLTAALYHDTGYLWSYENNEPLARDFAEETLPAFGYSDKQIREIGRLILSTAMPQRPENLLEEILCDADLDYVGRDDFFITALRLHREWSENSPLKISFRDWYERQRDFIEWHEFFTPSARLLRNEKKKKNLTQVKELLDLIETTSPFGQKKINGIKNRFL
jgi:predicted metal-dependent HD superfamily phosphohydrolase